MEFLKKCCSGIIKAGAMALARHGATLLGGVLLTWLLSHHVGADLAARLVGNLQDAIMTVTSIGLVAAGVGAALKDTKNVNGKIAVTASAAYDAGRTQGQQDGVAAQASADITKVAAVHEAMQTADAASKQDRTAVLDALKTGTF